MVWTKRAEFVVTDTVADLCGCCRQRSSVPGLCTDRDDLDRRTRFDTDVVRTPARRTTTQGTAGARAATEGTTTAPGARTRATSRCSKYHARRIGPSAR